MIEGYRFYFMSAATGDGWRFCLDVTPDKARVLAHLFIPGLMRTMRVPIVDMRKAVPQEYDSKRLRRMIERRLKDFKRWGRTCDAATARSVIEALVNDDV